MSPLSGISTSSWHRTTRALRITHDKGWVNDDDPGSAAPGWLRKLNLGTGDYNDDLTTSDTPGVVWSATFTGSSLSIFAPKEAGAGSIEIQIDGQTRDRGSLHHGRPHAQQLVFQVTGLTAGEHVISVIDRGPGPVAIDAIVVK